jgi:hypothetical protein
VELIPLLNDLFIADVSRAGNSSTGKFAKKNPHLILQNEMGNCEKVLELK